MEHTLAQLHTIEDKQAAALCRELRKELLRDVSQSGGHLASNLGTVELTVALHRVFDFTSDRLVFDVGHQCYTHKILSGRKEEMKTLRAFGGLSGFPKPLESIQDAFIAGHASNSVSVALGMARARTIAGQDYHVMALLGDGALTGGLAYEALSDAGQSGEPLLVILNDNGMSITQSVGGIAQHLAKQRLRPQYLRFKRGYRKVMSVLPGGGAVYRVTHHLKKILKESILPCSMFEDMGFTYMGPVDGHDLTALTSLLRYIKENLNGPVLFHVKTVKGKGYTHAEENPDAYHGVGRFDIATGKALEPSGESFSAVFGRTMCRLAGSDPAICAVTAAMMPGTGLKAFAAQFPDRFYDVGIAEEHAVAMAAGMAKQGIKPVFAVYSTFLQRAYDMLIHDVAIQALPVIFSVDRAGLVGEDGETHHGLYDIGFLSTVPGMEILAPASFSELESMLIDISQKRHGPVAIRYPRGGEVAGYHENNSGSPSVFLKRGEDITLITYGTMTGIVLEAASALEEQGIAAGVIKLNRLIPLDRGFFDTALCKNSRVLVIEEAASLGCMAEKIAAHLIKSGSMPQSWITLNTGDGFIPQGSITELRKLCGIDRDSIVRKALEVLKHG